MFRKPKIEVLFEIIYNTPTAGHRHETHTSAYTISSARAHIQALAVAVQIHLRCAPRPGSRSSIFRPRQRRRSVHLLDVRAAAAAAAAAAGHAGPWLIISLIAALLGMC